MDGDVGRRTTRRIVVLLEVSALLLVLFGGGALWFVATRDSNTPGPTNVVQAGATASVKLAWDRSPSPRVTGYRILSGTEPGNYTDSMSAGNEAATTLTNLKRGTRYYIVVVAIDAQGNQSPPSNEIEVVTPD